MGEISLVELFIRGGNGRQGTKPSALFDRPTEHGFDHLRDETFEVLQQLRFGVSGRCKSNDHLGRVDLISQLLGKEDRQEFGRVIRLAVGGIWELLRQGAVGIWKCWSGEVGECVDFGGNE